MAYRLVLLAGLGLVLISSCAPKPDDSVPSPAKTDNGAIEGFVREAGTDRPIEGASVFVVRSNDKPRLRTASDAKGHFILNGVEAGRHLVALSRPGYVFPGGTEGLTFRLTPGQHVNNVVFHLVPAGSIRGRVLNADGQPLKKVEIQLLRSMYLVGHAQWTAVSTGESKGPVETDSRGEFRVDGVEPGPYVVRFNPTEPDVESVIPGGKPAGPFLYPGTRDLAKATKIEVKAGSERVLDDVNLMREHRGWIHVLLTNVTGESLEGFGEWSLKPPGWIGSEYPLFQQRIVETAHEFQPDMPGTYEISAIWRTSKEILAGSLKAVYDGGDMDLKLTLDKARGRVTGSVMLQDTEGAPRRPLAGAEVSIGPDVPYFARTDADGAFVLPSVYGGRYKLGYVRGIPLDGYIFSVRQGNRDVLREDLLVSTGETKMDVIVGGRAGTLAGKVADGAGQLFQNALVALIPESPLRERSDYYGAYMSTPSDQNGVFELHGITPGAYQVYALSNPPAGAFRSTEFIRRFEGKGSPIMLDPGGRVSLDLKVLNSLP
jgi:hypothetical protein